jgi:hypothetical protein
MPRKSRAWFEARVKALADALRALPADRQRAVLDAIDAAAASEHPTPSDASQAPPEGRQPARRHGTGGAPDKTGAKVDRLG